MAFDKDGSSYQLSSPTTSTPRASGESETTKFGKIRQFFIDIFEGDDVIFALKSETQCIIEQVGADYPTPLPTGYKSRKFVGTKDPTTQVGITMDPLDEWSQPSA